MVSEGGAPRTGSAPLYEEARNPPRPLSTPAPSVPDPASRAARNRFLPSVGHSGRGRGHRSPRALRQCPSACHSPWKCFGGWSARLCPHAADRWGQHKHVSHHKRPCAGQTEGKLSLQPAACLPGAQGHLASVCAREVGLSPPGAPDSPAPWPAPFRYANRRKRGGGRGGHPRRGQTECLVCFPQRLLVVQPEPPSPTKTQILLETLHV